jgi:hypothetical protein
MRVACSMLNSTPREKNQKSQQILHRTLSTFRDAFATVIFSRLCSFDCRLAGLAVICVLRCTWPSMTS